MDITHYKSLTHEEVVEIQNEANRIVHRCRKITKSFVPKDEAERKYGFHLYQGGVVPGNVLRVVNIANTDTEACCGTHCDNTAEVGTIKISKTARISDGIVRLYFCAGEKALDLMNREADIIQTLSSDWGVPQQEIVDTAKRFFRDYKRFGTMAERQSLKIVELTMQVLLLDPDSRYVFVRSDQESATLYISQIPQYAQRLKESGKGVIFVGHNWLYGLIGDTSGFDPQEEIGAVVDDIEKNEAEKKYEEPRKKAAVRFNANVTTKPKDKKEKKKKIEGVVEFTVFSLANTAPVIDLLRDRGFEERE